MSIEHLAISELIEKGTQRRVAEEYARLIEDWGTGGYEVPWKEINEAILARWPKGLMRVKDMAWKMART